MYKYEECRIGDYPLREDLLFYQGDTSKIYKDGHYLYKVYTKKEPFRRQKLDYLLDHYDLLKDVSTPPIQKLKVDDTYGIKMHYLKGIDFLQYVNHCSSMDEFLKVLKELSERLKVINQLGIHFSDLHHHNILVQDTVPYYIDLDDASILNYGSCHISCISRNLHELEGKSYEYEDDLIKYGNLDQESLGIFLLDKLLDVSMEKKSYADFQRCLMELSPYIDDSLLDAFSRLKNEENSLKTIYTDYIGDYFTPQNIEGMKVFRKERI